MKLKINFKQELKIILFFILKSIQKIYFFLHIYDIFFFYTKTFIFFIVKINFKHHSFNSEKYLINVDIFRSISNTILAIKKLSSANNKLLKLV